MKSGRGQRILVAVAWPYANGHLHLGHIAGSLLPPDIFARYHRMRGDHVLMVSGSDCHGTPITVTAEKEGKTPQQVVEHYNAEHKKALEGFGIQFDLFTSTMTENHRKVVQDIFLTHRKNGHITVKETEGFFCPQHQRFLPDRYVEGTCPHCANPKARGDQCDKCGKTLDPIDLKEPRCKDCGTRPVPKKTKHFFFQLPHFEERLKHYIADKHHWRAATINFTSNWLKEGLKDRAITRDLTWGIPIPLPGYEGKRIYVWYEAVCGYLTASMEWSQKQGKPEEWKKWWHDPAAKSYYFLGKDNIPFHTIIWPSILMGYDPKLSLPYDVPANEYLMLGGEQFSKSRGIGIWVPDILAKFDPDLVRYYLSVNMPETRDANWTWEDFVAKVNDELVNTYGNFVHRTLSFAEKNFGEIPKPGALTKEDEEAFTRIEQAVASVADALERPEFKRGMREVMALAQFGNQYIDAQKPWKLIKEDRARCGTVLFVALNMVKALAVLTAPFLPFSANKVWKSLDLPHAVHEQRWEEAAVRLIPGAPLPEPKPLFGKLDLKEIVGDGTTMTTTTPPTAPSAKGATAAPPASAVGKPQALVQEGNGKIPFDDFAKVDLRVARILEVHDHPKADKLYVLKIDLGTETRQLVAGIKPYYPKDQLIGRKVIVVANLAPANLRGVESNGMLLAADDGKGKVSILQPDADLAPGAKVR